MNYSELFTSYPTWTWCYPVIKPHVETLVECASCGAKYCSVCNNACPKCYSFHIKESTNEK
jgi:hypothetical protein